MRGASWAISFDLYARNALRKPSGPHPVIAKTGIIFAESRHSNVRPDPLAPSLIAEMARAAMLRDAGLRLIIKTETKTIAAAAAARKTVRRLSDIRAGRNSRAEKTIEPTTSPSAAPRVPLKTMAEIERAVAINAASRARPLANSATAIFRGVV